MDRKTLKSLILLVTICLSWANELDSSHDGSPVHIRTRRSLCDFGSMIACATKRSCLDYSGYGCHCGFGGRGTAVDGVDRCCKAHDECYGRITADHRSSCDVFSPHYHYTSDNCWSAINWNPQINCDATWNSPCLQTLCECDRTAALCLSAATYHEKYSGYNRMNC